MKKISEIYKQYDIMPNLQEHQLRVAGVAQLICDNLNLQQSDPQQSIDRDAIITTCLLHDMGNIIKFNLGHFPEFRAEKGLEYWQRVKDEYIAKYGPEEHIATHMIVKEIGVSAEVESYLDRIGFSNLDKALDNPSLGQKICSYADMRVGPHGVISIEQRVADGIKRYAATSHVIASGKAPFLAECLKDVFQPQTTLFPVLFLFFQSPA